MLEIMKAKAKKYKNQYGKDTPVFTADEVLALIYEIEDNKSLGVYALKETGDNSGPSGNDLRDFILKMQKDDK